jgi:hypothetical protein
VWRFEALMSSMGLNTWQPIEVLVSLRPHAGHGFHPVFLIGVNVASNPHYLVFLVCSSCKSSLDGNARGRWGPIELLNAIGIQPGRILKY